jgi:hypothetical protein
LLFLEEDHGHACCDQHNNSSYHLINTSCSHSESNEHECGATHITCCRNSKQQWINFSFEIQLLCMVGPWRKQHGVCFTLSDEFVSSILVNEQPDSIETEAHELSQEHDCTLEIGVIELHS